jgi:hypothetical protein
MGAPESLTATRAHPDHAGHPAAPGSFYSSAVNAAHSAA